ncbi:hypothetical protein K2173_014751 [Erythroxylum novogranatense]|uniref:shikimate kinase n=1 Tax=Erythroxylum novogranatense TaxID=1862640 RepID=A0AAV8TI14_9ROSI|nr:hypothetical protein K2173_014751 [Erythroxylum novogranatense]
MDAKVAQSLQLSCIWINPENIRTKPKDSLTFSRRLKEHQQVQVFASTNLRCSRNKNRHRLLPLTVSCSLNNFPASTLESESSPASDDEALILKSKSQEIEPLLNGRCIYLVGMMGSGKTTIGKILSEVLDYSFFDSDKLVEQAVQGTSVAEIFKLHGETFFRQRETDALKELSLMHRLVVSTGGGAVVRPINWKYMNKGISVWLDVPLEALAQRIAAVGTHSRPLLHHEPGDAYTKALKRLSTLFEQRSDAYENANARVSLENIAAKLGHNDVLSLTPNIIAIEALEQIETFLEEESA